MHRKSTQDFFQECKLLFDSDHNLIYVVTSEEKRFCQQLGSEFSSNHLYTWSSVSGLREVTSSRISKSTLSPIDALDSVLHLPGNSMVVLCDFHTSLSDQSVVRKLRETLYAKKLGQRKILITAPELKLPIELEKMMAVMDFPLPNYDELNKLLYSILTSAPHQNRTKVELNKREKELYIEAALGLTLKEAGRAFKKSLLDDRSLTPSDIEIVLEQKKQTIRKSGFLEYFEASETMQDVGGMGKLKMWLDHRANAFGSDAKEFGLPEPKGILLMGVQGCGKSLVAKVISQMWKMPLLRFDMGKVFGSFIGSSESNMRKAIETAEMVSPCILWVDEIEKAVSGMTGSNVHDGGTTARVFATFLTWLQEKQAPVFVVATANQIDKLPPELIRKGRLDEIFFVDLPNLEERVRIVEIHLLKRKQELQNFDVPALAQLVEGYSGAEIEQVVVSALHKAFFQKEDLSQALLELAAKETVPISITMQEDIERLRSWADHRARKVS